MKLSVFDYLKANGLFGVGQQAYDDPGAENLSLSRYRDTTGANVGAGDAGYQSWVAKNIPQSWKTELSAPNTEGSNTVTIGDDGQVNIPEKQLATNMAGKQLFGFDRDIVDGASVIAMFAGPALASAAGIGAGAAGAAGAEAGAGVAAGSGAASGLTAGGANIAALNTLGAEGIATYGAMESLSGAAGAASGAASGLSAQNILSGAKTAASIISPIMSTANAVAAAGGPKASQSSPTSITNATPIVTPPVTMPTFGNENTINSLRSNIQQQLVRRGRAATILTSDTGSGSRLGN